MRGIQPLIDMRRAGERPAVVFIDTDAGPAALPRWAQWQNVDARLCDIDIDPSESLLRIDWRPVISMTVHVSGTTEARVIAVAKACDEAGAKRVISSLTRQVGQGEWIAFSTVWIRDTAGHMNTEEADCGAGA